MSGRPGTILMVHNRYQQRGGEDAVFEAESNLLERHGHTVHRMLFDNASIPERRTPATSVRLAMSTVWSRDSVAKIEAAIERFQPGVVHFHNTLPLVSPAGYYAARRQHVRTVQTLHNYRIMCPNALLFRDGGPCEDCIGRTVAWPGIRHKCYRDSTGQSAVVAATTAAHRIFGTWNRAVDQYVALTEFSRQKFIEGGLPESKITVKPNFLDSAPEPKGERGDAFLFVGRLAESKGIHSMLEAWTSQRLPFDLRIAGGGPLEATVEAAANAVPAITALGMLTPDQVIEEMQTARALVYPSTWYENFPMTLVEAFACGLPVIAARLGAMAEIIEDGRTGLLYTPGDAHDLACKVQWATANPTELKQMGKAARAEYDARYTGERNYAHLMRVYGWA